MSASTTPMILEALVKEQIVEPLRNVVVSAKNISATLKKAAATALIASSLFAASICPDADVLAKPGSMMRKYVVHNYSAAPYHSVSARDSAKGAEENEVEQRFESLSTWLQLGNQIRKFDDLILASLQEYRIRRLILLNSAYASENGYFGQLDDIVNSCHSAGIKVSAGTLVFKDNWILQYLEAHPESSWMSRSLDSETSSPYEHCLCPGRPEAHDFVIDKLVSEAKKSGVDEIHIDYEAHSCYDSFCREDFKKLYGFDPLRISMYDMRWKDFRNAQAVAFIKKLREKMNSEIPSTKLSFTAPPVAIDGYTAYDTCVDYADIAHYVDEIIPMVYVTSMRSSGTVFRQTARVSSIVKKANPKCKVSAGIILIDERTKEIKSPDRIEDEAISALKAHSSGLVLFEYRYIENEAAELIKKYL